MRMLSHRGYELRAWHFGGDGRACGALFQIGARGGRHADGARGAAASVGVGVDRVDALLRASRQEIAIWHARMQRPLGKHEGRARRVAASFSGHAHAALARRGAARGLRSRTGLTVLQFRARATAHPARDALADGERSNKNGRALLRTD